jgi:hypothetical protein
MINNIKLFFTLLLIFGFQHSYSQIKKSDLGLDITLSGYEITGKSGSYGVIKDGKKIIPNQYDSLMIPNPVSLELVGWIGFVVKDNGYWNWIDVKNKKKLKGKYKNMYGFTYSILEEDERLSEYYFMVQNETGKWGIINMDEKTIVPFEYEEIMAVGGEVVDYIGFKNNGKWGMKINHLITKWEVEPQWDHIDYKNLYKGVSKFDLETEANLLLPIKNNGKWGAWSTMNQKLVIQCEYDSIIVMEDRVFDKGFYGRNNLFQIIVVKDKLQGLLEWDKANTTYKTVIEPVYKKIMPGNGFRTSSTQIPSKKDKKWGIHHVKDGTWTPVEGTCTKIENFNALRSGNTAQLAAAYDDWFWGYVNTEGKWVIKAQYTQKPETFHTVVPRTLVLDNVENKLKWTLIDDSGKIITQPQTPLLDMDNLGVHELVKIMSPDKKIKYGLLDIRSGKELYPMDYEKIEISEGKVKFFKKELMILHQKPDFEVDLKDIKP